MHYITQKLDKQSRHHILPWENPLTSKGKNPTIFLMINSLIEEQEYIMIIISNPSTHEGRVSINREIKYLSFHVGHVVAASTLALSIALVTEVFSPLRVILASPC